MVENIIKVRKQIGKREFICFIPDFFCWINNRILSSILNKNIKYMTDKNIKSLSKIDFIFLYTYNNIL